MKTYASLLVVGLLLVCRPAGAYVLGAEFLMRLLADARRDVPKAYTLTLNTEVAGRDHPVEERLYVKRPERMRLVQMDDTTTISVVREGQSASGEDKVIRPQGPSHNLFAALVFPRGRDLDELSARLIKTLSNAGIDTLVTSLGRNEDQIVYIIGAQPWELDKPQLWLDKVSFLPVRTRLFTTASAPPGQVAVAAPPPPQPLSPAAAPGSTAAPPPAAIAANVNKGIAEMRFLEYGAGALPGVPRVFEEYVEGVLVRRGEVTQGQFNSDLPESLFDVTGAPPRRR